MLTKPEVERYRRELNIIADQFTNSADTFGAVADEITEDTTAVELLLLVRRLYQACNTASAAILSLGKGN